MFRLSHAVAFAVLGLIVAVGLVVTIADPAMARTATRPSVGSAFDNRPAPVGLIEFEVDGNAITANPNPGVPDDWDRLYAGTGSQLIWTGITPDTNNKTYRSGSTDLEDFPDLSWDYGSVPPKADITNSYVAVYADNHIFFGADRASTSGSTYIGFWLLQNAIGVVPGGTFSGNRTVGDVLILANFGGGGAATILVYRWDGVGILTSLPVDPNISFAIVNSAPITSPWPYPPGATPPNTIAAGGFFEGGADLGAVGINGCFSYFIAETRASAQLGSELKNFVYGALPTRPDVYVAPQNKTMCFGDPDVRFCARVVANTGAPPFTFAWTGPGGFSSTDSCITVGGGFAPGQYIYNVVVTGCNQCESYPVYDTLTVAPTPVASIDGPGLVCPGSTNSHCGPAGAASYAWTISGNGSIVGAANGQCVSVLAGTACNQSYTLDLVIASGAGCAGTARKVVNVNDTAAPSIVCPGNITIQCTESADPGRTGTATATDNCDASPAITHSDVTRPGGCPQGYTIARTWVATDDCGNSATCLQTITVVDSRAPVITCPGDRTIECTESTDPGHTGTATATDSCDTSPTIGHSDSITPGRCPQAYTIARTWTATDDCGNSATCLQTITVVDRTAPVITCPGDRRIECTEATDPGHTGRATATDNCDAAADITFSDQTTPGSCPAAYSIARTWVATDDCGNSATCLQTITVVDSTAPVITCPGSRTIECSDATDPGHTGSATATDNCDGSPDVTFSDNVTPGACQDSRVIARTWRAVDDCGNTATCLQTITVVDRTAPVITCPGDRRLECDEPFDPNFTGWATATDNCDGTPDVTYNDVSTPGQCLWERTISRTWTARDNCGNSASCLQTITIEDNDPPRIECPGTAYVECDDSTDPENTGYARATDDCDTDPTIDHRDTRHPGECPQEYVIERVWIAWDDCGNSATCTQNVVVRDDTPPRIECPRNTTVECDESTDPSHTGRAAARDDCDTSADVDYDDDITPGACPGSYTIARTWIATDDCGNSDTCLQTITVEDTTDPVITCPSNRSFECDDPVDFGQATATDNCDHDVAITYSDNPIPGSHPGESKVERTWIATDDCGNSATCLQVVTIFDDTPPIMTCPGDRRFECDEQPDFGEATAVDACDPDPDITHSDVRVPGRCSESYDIRRTWVATDAAGNSSTCLQVVTVFDATPPEITCPPDDEFEFGQDIVFGDPTVRDNCDPSVDVTHSDQHRIGICPQTYTVERTWVARDDCGNSATCLQTITVHDETPPVITCPNDRVFECDQQVDYGQATATDTGDPSPEITYNDVMIPGSCGYTVLRTWTATDDCGNSATCLQTVRVTDTHAPVITCPTDRQFNCDAPIDFGEARATDNCDTFVEITFSDETVTGSNPSEYQIRRTWRATDDCGNSSTCLQIVTVRDLTPPRITCPGDRTFECTDPIVFGDPTYSDNCDTQLALTFNDVVVPGPSPQQYQIRRTWRVTDDSNNLATCVQTVSVVDRAAPVIEPLPNYTVACNAPVEFGVPHATDTCDPNPVIREVSTTVEPGPGACEYTHTRCWVALDATGNSSSPLCQVIIQPVDAQAPIVTCAPDKEINEGDPVVFDEPTVTDNCPMEPELRTSGGPGGGAVAQAETSYTRCWTAVDLCGNVSDECCQTITVKAQGPQFCTFTCYIWTSACLEDPNREISTTPACVRDDYFDDVFPNGLVIGNHSAPRRYTVTFTNARAVENFKCGYGLPAALTRDYVDPARVQLGSIYGEILALRLNREFSCGGYFEGWGFPDSIACFGSYVVPPEVSRFAGLTVDQLLAVADQALSGNTSALIPYGNSFLRLQAAAAYMNWLYGNCAGAERPEQPPFALSSTHDSVDDGQATPDASVALPDKFALSTQPNPLRSSVTISLAMPVAGDVSAEIFDIQGRKVATVMRQHASAGYHTISWNSTDSLGRPVASGVYFLRVQVDGEQMAMQKLMKL